LCGLEKIAADGYQHDYRLQLIEPIGHDRRTLKLGSPVALVWANGEPPNTEDLVMTTPEAEQSGDISRALQEAARSATMPIAVPLPEARRLLGNMARSKVYDLLGKGMLVGLKDGKKLLITTASIEAHMQSLPRAAIAPPRPKRPKPFGARFEGAP
jgi:hypothetical protein